MEGGLSGPSRHIVTVRASERGGGELALQSSDGSNGFAYCIEHNCNCMLMKTFSLHLIFILGHFGAPPPPNRSKTDAVELPILWQNEAGGKEKESEDALN